MICRIWIILRLHPQGGPYSCTESKVPAPADTSTRPSWEVTALGLLGLTPLSPDPHLRSFPCHLSNKVSEQQGEGDSVLNEQAVLTPTSPAKRTKPTALSRGPGPWLGKPDFNQRNIWAVVDTATSPWRGPPLTLKSGCRQQ
ncbi:hypothetical protein mRhiFer1_008464 [Rhinolophus ferrumequinum]|uniref:Uncharacterized protein n=1 Tax=Rhinolophus ferrumequinum TaxID=59479 RepID=A0A7J7V874_RHIFE|nr:hypothetical protein mRhiFer1_008464 [Rhinolophus ferrumequinum]